MLDISGANLTAEGSRELLILMFSQNILEPCIFIGFFPSG